LALSQQGKDHLAYLIVVVPKVPLKASGTCEQEVSPR
jgi:hypothetical protein